MRQDLSSGTPTSGRSEFTMSGSTFAILVGLFVVALVVTGIVLAGPDLGWWTRSRSPEDIARAAEARRNADAEAARAKKERADADAKEAEMARKTPDELAQLAVETLSLRFPDNVYSARNMMARIPKTKQNERLIKKTGAAIDAMERRGLLEMRRKFASGFDQHLTDRRIEGDVRLAGTDGTTLHIESWLCGKVFLNDEFGTEEAQHMMKGLHFKQVSCVTATATYTQEF